MRIQATRSYELCLRKAKSKARPLHIRASARRKSHPTFSDPFFLNHRSPDDEDGDDSDAYIKPVNKKTKPTAQATVTEFFEKNI